MKNTRRIRERGLQLDGNLGASHEGAIRRLFDRAVASFASL